MTKYEWETELKKNIGSLPVDEVKRVLEYYGELFEDMTERGKSERAIINDFGNPFDVAEKIVSEYEGELEISGGSSAFSETSDNAIERLDERQKDEESNDYNSRNKADEKSVTIQKVKSGGNIDAARLVLFILFNIFTGGIAFILLGTVWIVLAVLTLSGCAIVLCGGVAAISSFAVMGTGHAGAGFAQLGVSVALAGFGILLAVGCVMLIKLYCKLNKTIFGFIKNILIVKER